MTITLHSYFEGLERSLATLDHILDKAAAHAAEQGVEPAQMLGWRLIDDMHPLAFQACVVRNFVASWVARAHGSELPADLNWESVDFATLRAEIADSLVAVRALMHILVRYVHCARQGMTSIFMVAHQWVGLLPPVPQWVGMTGKLKAIFGMLSLFQIH